LALLQVAVVGEVAIAVDLQLVALVGVEEELTRVERQALLVRVEMAVVLLA
jgi:hypothetical protein